MRFTTAAKTLAVVAILAGAMQLAAQNMTNPISQIRWSVMTGSGDPAAQCQATAPPPAGKAAPGQMYFDMVPPNAVSTCLNVGGSYKWVKSAVLPAFGTAAPNPAACTSPANGYFFVNTTAPTTYYICNGATATWLGPLGATGPTGATGATGPPLAPRGAWNASTAYATGDIVSYNNASYTAIQPNTNVVPTNTTTWQLLVNPSTLVAGQPAGVAYSGPGQNATALNNSNVDGSTVRLGNPGGVAQATSQGYEGQIDTGRGYPASQYSRLPLGYTNMLLRCQAGQHVTVARIGTSFETILDDFMYRDLIAKCGAPIIPNNLAYASSSGNLVPYGRLEAAATPGHTRFVLGAGTSGPCANFQSQPLTVNVTNPGSSWFDLKYDQEPEGGSATVTVDGAPFGTINYQAAASTYWQDYYIPLDPSTIHTISIPPPTNGCGYWSLYVLGPNGNTRGPGGFVYMNLAYGGRSESMLTGQQTFTQANVATSSSTVAAPGSQSVNVSVMTLIAVNNRAIIDNDTNRQQAEDCLITAVGSNSFTCNFVNTHAAGFSVYPYNTSISGSVGLNQIASKTNPNGGLSSLLQARPTDPLGVSLLENFHATNDPASLSNSPCTNGVVNASGGVICWGNGGTTLFKTRSASTAVVYYGASEAITATASDSNQYVYIPVIPFGTARGVSSGTTGAAAVTFNPALWSLTVDGTVNWYNLGPIATTTSFDVAEMVNAMQMANSGVIQLRYLEAANDSCFPAGSMVNSFPVAGNFCALRFRAMMNTFNAYYQPPYLIGSTIGTMWNSGGPLSFRLGEIMSMIDWDAIQQGQGFAQSYHAPFKAGDPHPNDYGFGDPKTALSMQAPAALGIGDTWGYAQGQPTEDMQGRYATGTAYMQPTEPLCAPPGSKWVDTSNKEYTTRRKFSGVGRPTSLSGGCYGGVWETISGPAGPESGSLLEEMGTSVGPPAGFGSGTANTVPILSTNSGFARNGARPVSLGATYTASWVIVRNSLLDTYGAAATAVNFANVLGLVNSSNTNNILAWDMSTRSFAPYGTAPAAPYNCALGQSDSRPGGASDNMQEIAGANEQRCSVTIVIPTATQILDLGAATGGINPPTGIAWQANTAVAQNSYITTLVNVGLFNFQATTGGTTGATIPTFATSCATTGTSCTDGGVTWKNLGAIQTAGLILVNRLVVTNAPTWKANTAINTRNSIRVTVAGTEYAYTSYYPGTTAATAPDWTTCVIANCTVQDGTVNWRFRGLYYPAYMREVRLDRAAAAVSDGLMRFSQSTGYGPMNPQPQSTTPYGLKPGMPWADNSNSDGVLWKQRITAQGGFIKSTADTASTELDSCTSALCSPVVPPTAWTCSQGAPFVSSDGAIATIYIAPLQGGVSTPACQFSWPIGGGSNNYVNAVAANVQLSPSTTYTVSFKFSRSFLPWKPSTAFTSETISVLSGGIPVTFKATTAGTSGATQPVWCISQSITQCTVQDGTVVWTQLAAASGLQVPILFGLLYGTRGATNQLSQDLATWWTGGYVYSSATLLSFTYGANQTPASFTFTSPPAGMLGTNKTLWLEGNCGPGTTCTISDMQLVRGSTAIVNLAPPVYYGTTPSLGGSALAANACASSTITVLGATPGGLQPSVNPAVDPNAAGTQNYNWYATVTAANSVLVKLCALVAGTPAATTYRVSLPQ